MAAANSTTRFAAAGDRSCTMDMVAGHQPAHACKRLFSGAAQAAAAARWWRLPPGPAWTAEINVQRLETALRVRQLPRKLRGGRGCPRGAWTGSARGQCAGPKTRWSQIIVCSEPAVRVNRPSRRLFPRPALCAARQSVSGTNRAQIG